MWEWEMRTIREKLKSYNEPQLKSGYKKHTVKYFYFYVHKIKINIKEIY